MYRPGIAYGWASSPEALMSAADMNARTDQSNDDVSFIRTMFLLDRNVVLRFCCRAKQQRCQRAFPLVPAAFSSRLHGRKLEDCPEINIACQGSRQRILTPDAVLPSEPQRRRQYSDLSSTPTN